MTLNGTIDTRSKSYGSRGGYGGSGGYGGGHSGGIALFIISKILVIFSK